MLPRFRSLADSMIAGRNGRIEAKTARDHEVGSLGGEAGPPAPTSGWAEIYSVASWAPGALIRLRSAPPAGEGDRVKYNHVGIPTTGTFEGEIPLKHLKLTVSDHLSNPYGIQWQRYWDDAPYPDLVKTVPHVAFEVDDLAAALDGQQVIIEPNSPSRGVLVAFVEIQGAPVELMQIDHQARPDL